LLSGPAAAMHFGYSSARVKAMESRLISKKTMQEIINAKDASSIIAILFKEDYKNDLEEFGGLEIKEEMIDFALSKNLAKNVAKLVQISPTTERKLMRAIEGKWDLYNVKIVIEAKDRGASYESIARYLMDYGIYNLAFVREVMREDSIEGIIGKCMINSPYSGILREALDSYKKSRNAIDAVATIDRQYYKALGSVITGLRVMAMNSARTLKMDIDMKNIMLLIKAKRADMKFGDISGNIIGNGNISSHELEQVYNGSKDIPSMVSQIKQYDLKEATDMFTKGRNQLLLFEISMRNALFKMSSRLLNHRILTFGTILAYAYMKEIEVFTLRILINSKIYGLSREEVQRLIIWKSE
jgi:ATP synthase A1 C subunit